MSRCSDAPDDEVISLFAGLLGIPDVPLSQSNSSSRRVLRRRPCILRIKTWQRILRDSRYSSTVFGEQRDRSVHIQLQVDEWRYRPLVIRVRVRKQWNNSPNTQYNLVFPDIFCPHRWGQKNSHIWLVVLGCHPRTMPSHAFLMTHMNFGVHLPKTRETTVNVVVSGSSRCTW
jgi:hypothetical protein